MLTFTDYRPTFADRSRWTLPDILRARAESHGDRVYLDVPHEDRRFTFAETLAAAERVGSGLLARGHEPGDRVLIMLPNCAEYVLAWMGAALAGMAEVPVNTAYRGSFLEHQVRTVAPTVAVIAPEFAEQFVESRPAAASIRRVFLVPPAGELVDAGAVSMLEAAGYDVDSFEVLLTAPIGPLPTVRARDLAAVFFTSGTTGLSKGVMMPHAHMVFFADECVSLTRLDDGDVYLSVGPLFHGNATFLAAYPALIAGARFVLRERFSASRWLTWIRESGATVTNFVGVMMDFVWKQPPSEVDRDNDLRCIFAAPTASSILQPFKDRFGVEAFVEVFGLTETSMPIMSPYGIERPAGAAGLLVDGWFDIRLVDPDTDEEVPVGELGELVVRSRYPFTSTLGYFGMPERTVEAQRNCWFHTGDGLRRDADGWYYFVDRLKDAIRRRGENISSYEVEQAILPHPAVLECAVVAIPADVDAGEDEVMVCVVTVPGAELTVEELWAWCDRRLPYFAVPRYVRFLDELPKTPSAKVQKAKLRELGIDGETHDRSMVLGEKPGRR